MEELLSRVKQLKIEIRLHGDELKLRIPRGVDATEVVKQIRQRRDDLVAFIRESKIGDSDFWRIDPVPEKAYYPLSSAQKRLYIIYELNRNSLAYNMVTTVLLEGVLDKDRLATTFQTLVTRHDSLRTGFIQKDHRIVQKVNAVSHFRIRFGQATEQELPDRVRQFVRPFNLAEAPLFRVAVLEISPQKHLLMVDIHHIVSDGISQNILMQEFVTLYRGGVLAPLTLQYKDFSVWEQSERRQQEVKRQEQIWLQEFADGGTTLDLPVDKVRPEERSFIGDGVSFSLSKEQTLALKQIVQEQHTTVFILLLALYNVLLSKLTYQEDIVVGVPVAGRNHVDLERILGMFVNTLPLRNFPHADMSFLDFLSAVTKKTLLFFDCQAFQFEQLVESLKIDRILGTNPIFDTVFSYNSPAPATAELPGLTLTPYNNGQRISKFSITMTATEVVDQLYFQIEYVTDLFERKTVERFCKYFKRITSAVIENQHIKLADIMLLTMEEQLALWHKSKGRFVINRKNNIQPVGVPGELCFSDPEFAQHYFNKEDWNEQAFVPHPLKKGVKLYKTGCLVRVLNDGNLAFLGRVDNQVKVRGHTFALNKIERFLLQLDAVQEVAVIVSELSGEHELITYYVSEVNISDRAFADFLSAKLPTYMVPRFYLRIEAVPYTVYGKLNKCKLPIPEQLRGTQYIPSTNDVEARLVLLWGEVLDLPVDKISVVANFFEVGGHSLSAVYLTNRIYKSFNVKVSLAQVFKHKNIRALAKFIASMSHASTELQTGSVDSKSLHPQVLLLKQGSDINKNLFFIHDGSGDVLGYLPLARQMQGYTSWGIRSHLLEGRGPQDITLSEIANRCITAIQSIQSRGPYTLIGWSHGGMIAHEMAQQLNAGKQVQGLVMIDTDLNLFNAGQIRDFTAADEQKLIRQVLPGVNMPVDGSVANLWKGVMPMLSKLDPEKIRALLPPEIISIIPQVERLEVMKLVAYFNAIRSIDLAVRKRKNIRGIPTTVYYIKALGSFPMKRALLKKYAIQAEYIEIEGTHISIMQENEIYTLRSEVDRILKYIS